VGEPAAIKRCDVPNPYSTKAREHFWKPAVAEVAVADIRPIRAKRFALADDAIVATAGSCFAQNVSRHLKQHTSMRVLETEEIGPEQPPFSARYGNIYTSRQLVQLFDEAFHARKPADLMWRRADATWVDGLRPFMFAAGFMTEADAIAERCSHLAAVRRVFTECTTFVFTLGLTEGWISERDGTVYPVCPGVVSDLVDADRYAFHNFSYAEIVEDIAGLVTRMRQVNPSASIILTVSPVPLTATFTDEHVVVATMHSKSVLRAVCGVVESEHTNVYYFPSYEIIAGPFTRGMYYASNLRTITDEGIAHVMRVFDATYRADLKRQRVPEGVAVRPEIALFVNDGTDVICDDEGVVRSVGF
jgi:hypothetical protein